LEIKADVADIGMMMLSPIAKAPRRTLERDVSKAAAALNASKFRAITQRHGKTASDRQGTLRDRPGSPGEARTESTDPGTPMLSLPSSQDPL
jgi:hypothetical protein